MGGLASNYRLSTGQTTAAFITPAPLSVSDISASGAVSGNFKPGTAVLVGLIGADKVAAQVELDNPNYSSPGYLAVGSYKQGVSSLTGADASNYALTAFTTPVANYTVSPIPAKSTTANQIMAAVLNQLPSNSVAMQSSNAIVTKASTPQSPSANQATAATSTGYQTLPANAPVASSGLTTQSKQSTSSQAIKRSGYMLQAKVQTGSGTFTGAGPSLSSGFAEQDLDFAPPVATLPALPDVFANTTASLGSHSMALDDEALDLEDRIYAGVREVLQSPVTFQVLSGASSVAFLVKTLVPSLLPTFQVPGGLPSNAPVRLPTQPGNMLSGRTTLGRRMGRA